MIKEKLPVSVVFFPYEMYIVGNCSGAHLRSKIAQKEEDIRRLESQRQERPPEPHVPAKNLAWQNFRTDFKGLSNNELDMMLASGPAQNQLYGGRMNQTRRLEVVSVTTDAIRKLHESIETMPAEGDEEEQPMGLRSSISLFPHQKQVIQFNSLFHFTQSNTILYCLRIIYVINKLFIQSGCFQLIFHDIGFISCMSCRNTEGISCQPCSTLYEC